MTWQWSNFQIQSPIVFTNVSLWNQWQFKRETSRSYWCSINGTKSFLKEYYTQRSAVQVLESGPSSAYVALAGPKSAVGHFTTEWRAADLGPGGLLRNYYYYCYCQHLLSHWRNLFHHLSFSKFYLLFHSRNKKWSVHWIREVRELFLFVFVFVNDLKRQSFMSQKLFM